MKQILIIILGLVSIAYGQSVGQFRYDSTMFLKNGGNNELIIMNGTRGVTGGALVNTGNGRTSFQILPGGFNTSVGSGFKIAINGTNNVKSLTAGWGLIIDSATSNQIKHTVDSTTLKDVLWARRGNTAVSGDYAGTNNSIDYILKRNGVTGLTVASGKTVLTGNLELPAYPSTSTTGIIYQGTVRMMSSFAASGTSGDNFFSGPNAGNLSLFGSSSGSQGSLNVGLGPAALLSLTTGARNTAAGTYSQQNTSSGTNNTSFGQNTLNSNSTGYNNTVGGVRASAFGNGHDQVAWGVDALSRGNTASFNVGVGTDALYNVWDGLYNVAVGDSTLWLDSTGFKNTAIGSRAGYYLGDTYPKFATLHDSLVTFIGADASRDSSVSSATAINNSTAIGYNAKVDASNQVVIGNNNVTSTILKGAVTGRWKARVGSTTSSATPTINTDNVDIYKLTAQAADITSMSSNLSGTPADGDILEIQITGTAARAITWGASFVSSTVTLPTTTVTTATLTTIFQYYTTSSYGNNKWVCVNYY